MKLLGVYNYGLCRIVKLGWRVCTTLQNSDVIREIMKFIVAKKLSKNKTEKGGVILQEVRNTLQL